jgi:hypothetical protein
LLLLVEQPLLPLWCLRLRLPCASWSVPWLAAEHLAHDRQQQLLWQPRLRLLLRLLLLLLVLLLLVLLLLLLLVLPVPPHETPCLHVVAAPSAAAAPVPAR